MAAVECAVRPTEQQSMAITNPHPEMPSQTLSQLPPKPKPEPIAKAATIKASETGGVRAPIPERGAEVFHMEKDKEQEKKRHGGERKTGTGVEKEEGSKGKRKKSSRSRAGQKSVDRTSGDAKGPAGEGEGNDGGEGRIGGNGGVKRREGKGGEGGLKGGAKGEGEETGEGRAVGSSEKQKLSKRRSNRNGHGRQRGPGSFEEAQGSTGPSVASRGEKAEPEKRSIEIGQLDGESCLVLVNSNEAEGANMVREETGVRGDGKKGTSFGRNRPPRPHGCGLPRSNSGQVNCTQAASNAGTGAAKPGATATHKFPAVTSASISTDVSASDLVPRKIGDRSAETAAEKSRTHPTNRMNCNSASADQSGGSSRPRKPSLPLLRTSNPTHRPGNFRSRPSDPVRDSHFQGGHGPRYPTSSRGAYGLPMRPSAFGASRFQLEARQQWPELGRGQNHVGSRHGSQPGSQPGNGNGNNIRYEGVGRGYGSRFEGNRSEVGRRHSLNGSEDMEKRRQYNDRVCGRHDRDKQDRERHLFKGLIVTKPLSSTAVSSSPLATENLSGETLSGAAPSPSTSQLLSGGRRAFVSGEWSGYAQGVSPVDKSTSQMLHRRIMLTPPHTQTHTQTHTRAQSHTQAQAHTHTPTPFRQPHQAATGASSTGAPTTGAPTAATAIVNSAVITAVNEGRKEVDVAGSLSVPKPSQISPTLYVADTAGDAPVPRASEPSGPVAPLANYGTAYSDYTATSTPYFDANNFYAAGLCASYAYPSGLYGYSTQPQLQTQFQSQPQTGMMPSYGYSTYGGPSTYGASTYGPSAYGVPNFGQTMEGAPTENAGAYSGYLGGVAANAGYGVSGGYGGAGCGYGSVNGNGMYARGCTSSTHSVETASTDGCRGETTTQTQLYSGTDFPGTNTSTGAVGIGYNAYNGYNGYNTFCGSAYPTATGYNSASNGDGSLYPMYDANTGSYVYNYAYLRPSNGNGNSNSNGNGNPASVSAATAAGTTPASTAGTTQAQSASHFPTMLPPIPSYTLLTETPSAQTYAQTPTPSAAQNHAASLAKENALTQAYDIFANTHPNAQLYSEYGAREENDLAATR